MNYRLTALLAILLCSCVRAQTDDAKWTVDDIVHTEYVSNVSFSPNGSMVLWSKQRAAEDKKKDKFVHDLYLTRLDSRKDGEFRTVRLTTGDDSDHSAVFSRDGEDIYFLSGRDEGKKLWKMSVYGGEAQEVQEFKNGISDPQWIDEHTLAYVSYEGKTLTAQELEEKKDDVVVIEDTSSWKIDRLYAYDLKEKQSTRLTENVKPVGGYSVSRDGKYLAYVLKGSPHQAADAQPKSEYYLKELATGTERRIFTGLQGPRNLQFSLSGERLYFTATKSSDPEWDGAGIGQLYYLPVNGTEPQAVELDWENGVEDITVVGNDVVASLANRATMRQAIYRPGGKRRDIDLDTLADHVSLMAFSEDGKKVVFQYSTASRLPTYFVADFTGDAVKNPEELVKLNQNLKKKSIARSEVIEWEGYEGELVSGILYYPANYREGRKYPLMLSIHGGPSGADLDRWSERWSTYPQLLSQRGAFVLKPNYHGSSNHGLSYVESIKQNYYEPEMEDITAGIDRLIAEGKVHPDSLGSMGWSNGAILTTMLTVRYPDRFKVACPGAGDVNWTSDFGTCSFGVSFDQSYFGGAPWDDTNGKNYNENYLIKSPLFDMEKVKTPTIIFHGSEDRAVPRDQGWEYYRALQQIAQAPVRFLWFPGQPHGLQRITHQKRKMEEELAWIDTYLFGKDSKDNPALKEGSPLAQLLEKDTVAKHDELYGQYEDDILLPELVSLGADTISIARFELTAAQYAAFDPQYPVTVGGGNLPAELTRPQAEAYLAWLSKKMGRQARMPNEKEAKQLQEQARKVGAKENTLNFWAGYEITRDEVTDLRRKVNELRTTLIKPVGSFAPVQVGKVKLYDVGGNVAEYTSGTGHYGYSAYDFVDSTGGDEVPASDHIGLRVVVDQAKR
ncbi:dipeptidyl aminopeptidase/acylaminoacyl peptidase [Lewinella aquimaris]|uniref:Dipeptidyl aminopeptidase/acylaminoacyl peptidase n=1 Tax=Neolewinella aquimaris TaxID=1835722 RepID=A0A840E8K5_9BACT|nr:prolyl oligopeptidase family serine peptidase [Neolewinella aquimaris]MBB4078129.1 dipeptidyl aminopeptidase/acylaminoacyl peptidase [Neolewinella aquimaris]